MKTLPSLAFLCIPALAAEVNGVDGIDAPAMASFDRHITSLMNKYRIPGGAVAVAKNGKLVPAHGYGMADVEAHQTVSPDSLFRVASLSKPFTAAAIGKLHLDDKPFSMLHFEPPPDKTTGQRYEDYVRTAVLAPMQIRRMCIGNTLPEQRANGEVI